MKKDPWLYGAAFVSAIVVWLLAACSAFTQPPSQSAARSLGGTAWQLVKFQGSGDTTRR
jgi:hypothetical protein